MTVMIKSSNHLQSVDTSWTRPGQKTYLQMSSSHASTHMSLVWWVHLMGGDFYTQKKLQQSLH